MLSLATSINSGAVTTASAATSTECARVDTLNPSSLIERAPPRRIDSAPKRDSASASMSTTPSTGVAPDPRNDAQGVAGDVERGAASIRVGCAEEIPVERQHLRCRDRERARISRQIEGATSPASAARAAKNCVCARRRVLSLAQHFRSRTNGKAARAIVRSQASPGKGAIAADQTRAVRQHARLRRADVPIAADRTDVVGAGQERIARRQHDVATGRNAFAARQVERIPGDDRRRAVHRDVVRSEAPGKTRAGSRTHRVARTPTRMSRVPSHPARTPSRRCRRRRARPRSRRCECPRCPRRI